MSPRARCPSCTRRLIERGTPGNWECEVMPCHGPKGTAIVPVPPSTCPLCGSATHRQTWAQPALFWLHGFGADEVTAIESCPSCNWRRETPRHDVQRPAHRAA